MSVLFQVETSLDCCAVRRVTVTLDPFGMVKERWEEIMNVCESSVFPGRCSHTRQMSGFSA